MPGRIGATSSPAWTPAAVSRASARSRAAGTGERSSSRRASRAIGVASEMLTVTSCRSPSRWSRSMSRVTSGDLVMIPMRETAVVQQQLEDPAGEPELPLGGLVAVGGGADDQRMAAQPRGIERAGQHLGDVGLDQDALLERLPGGHRLGVVGAAALHGVAVGVARVAVGAAELAADVRIDGPEAHVGAGGRC